MSELNFIWPAIWQELTNHAAVILLYILFLHHENARNVVQGNPKILKFSLGSMPADPPYKFVSSLP